MTRILLAGVIVLTAACGTAAEHPVDAARRAAPYTHLTHAKDAIIFFCDEGLRRQGRPAGRDLRRFGLPDTTRGSISDPAATPIILRKSLLVCPPILCLLIHTS